MVAFIGSTSGHTTLNQLTLSYPAGTTPGNFLVAGVTVFSTVSAGVNSVTNGPSTADHWAVVNNSNPQSVVWADPNCAGGVASFTVYVGYSGGAGLLTAFIMEFSGVKLTSPVDKQSSGTNFTNNYTSGTTATTTNPYELWVGMAGVMDTSPLTINPPGAPWTSLTAVSSNNSGYFAGSLMGYQIVSATGGALFAGSSNAAVSPGAQAAVVTFLPIPTRTGLLVSSPAAVRRASNW